MAPALVLEAPTPSESVEYVNDFHRYLFSAKMTETARGDKEYRHSAWLPTYPNVSWEPLQLLKNLPEPGRAVDCNVGWRHGQLLARPDVRCSDMSPSLGNEVWNVDLRTLTTPEKNELGAMLAERGLVIFRGQSNFTIQDQADLVSHFGPLYEHPSSGIPSEDLSHIRVLYQGPEGKPPHGFISSVRQWHHDSPYELNPPGVVSMQLLCAPPSGGDTVFASGYDTYDALSPGLQSFVETLQAEHRPGFLDPLKFNLHQRRPITSAVHPVICVHPVTGWKTTYVTSTKLTTFGIHGLPQSESEMLIDYLGALARDNVDAQVRLRWDEETVAFWDNRCVFHSATFNFWPHRRHAILVSAISNKPLSVEEARKEFEREPTSRAKEIASQEQHSGKV